jgi:hypothetical protein
VVVHQTTIRFANDAWQEVERQARLHGVSAAQYVREATLARLVSAAEREAGELTSTRGAPETTAALAARVVSTQVREGSEAVWAQAQLARSRAREAREASRMLQGRGRASR